MAGETNDLYKITYKTSDEGDPIPIPLLADEAKKLENAQDLQVALGSDYPQSFDGSGPAQSIGVDGVLPVEHGGTGAESLADITVGKATEAEKVGSTTVGGVATPIYNKAGVLTKIGDGANDVGGDTYPIYLTKDGELKSVANELAKKSELSDGTVTKIGTSDVGTSTEPIYIKAGVPTATDGTLDKDISGNAATTTKLKTARTLTVDLTSESTPSFDGSENVTIGVQETLPVSHGGTGQTELDNVVVGVAKAIGTAVSSLMNVGGAAQPVYFADGVPVATTSVGALIDLEMDEEYKITAKLMNNAGTVIATSDAIDLPLEEMVIGGKYDKDTKTLSLKIRNKDDDEEDDSWLDIPVGDLIDGLVSTSDMASATENGLMSSEDYIKLQGIEESANNYSLPVAKSDTLGGVKVGFSTSATDRDYAVQIDTSNNLYVNVPWTDTVPSIPGYNLTYGDKTIILKKDGETLDTVNLETAIGYASSLNNGLMRSSDYDALVSVVAEALRNENAYANTVALTMDDEYKIKVTLSNVEGEVISTSEAIDLPLEELIIDGEYDAENKKIILYFNSDDDEENGDNKPPLEIPVGDLIDGLASESDLDSYAKLSATNIFTGKTQTIKAQYPRLVLTNTDSAAANQLFLGAASNNIWGLGDNINGTVMWLVYANNGDFYDGTTQPIPRVAWNDTGDASTPVYFAKGIPVVCTNVATKDDIAGITFPAYTMTSDSSAHTISLLKDGAVVGSAINLATVIGMASGSSDGLMSQSDYAKLAGLSALQKASPTTLGGIMTGFTTTGKDYAVVVDDDGNAYVNVPWTDTTYSNASSSAAGLMTSALYTKLNGLSINGSSSWDSLSIVAPTDYGTKGQYLTTNDNADGFTWKTLEAGTTLTETGSSSVPVYINSSGQPATCSNISADTAVKVGNGATASGSAAVAVGGGASAVPGNAIALGRYASCPKSGTRPIAIGRYAESSGAYSIAIGSNSGDDDENTIASGDHAVAIGLQAEAAYEDSIAIGYGTKTTKTGEVVIGNINLTELKELVEQLEQLIKVGNNTATQLVFEEE